MLDAASSSRVGAEFTGLARMFRSAVKAEDKQVDVALAMITTPLRARLRRHPRLRPEAPMGTLRTWAESMPTSFRLGHPRIAHHKTEFAIAEHRLSASWISDRSWGDDAPQERGVSICKLTFAAQRGKLVKTWQPLATVSLHALGRWFERSGERDQSALVRDLALLIAASDEAEKIDTPGGFWLGAVINAVDDVAKKGVKLRNVRTWISDG
jgi:hypothetical protein